MILVSEIFQGFTRTRNPSLMFPSLLEPTETLYFYQVKACLHLTSFSPFNAAPFNGPFFD